MSSCEEDADERFVCGLGTHGQVILYQPDTDAVLSRFEFVYPPTPEDEVPGSLSSPTGNAGLSVDKDGDLIVPRNQVQKQRIGTVVIEHQQSTSLSLVGEQVWRGAFFLADYLLHSLSQSSSVSQGSHFLELASGVGLTAVVAGMFAEFVIATDIQRGNILPLLRNNIVCNKELVGSLKAIGSKQSNSKSSSVAPNTLPNSVVSMNGSSIHVAELDFSQPKTIDELLRHGLLADITLIFAADVVYYNDLTEQFFDTVHRLMSYPPNKELLVALEKRFVFTTAELDISAPCYDYFLHCLDRLIKTSEPHPAALLEPRPLAQHSRLAQSIKWSAEQLTGDHFPQYFSYERTKHLVLWRIRAVLH